ncbi:D-ribitol-5-phosphate cytidylyltransferase-like [Amphibalanus amphitrite]|uniref:D-ribitol-5-phosphate cytidylyltransferase-like n=1 Tax=Amphibalanus amphitrite TaxID=1232801 RepID=UPI001C916274|nr:D-ribitol-5-phosphate cytidylyltransferase-like [Amphibalanus amphitrite]
MPNAWVLVPAAGCGERFGDECPKQFSLVHGHTLISYTISSLLACEEVKKVIVVTSDQTRVGNLPSWWCHVLDAYDQVTSGSQPKLNYKNSADKPDGNALVQDYVAGLDKNDDLSVDSTDQTFASEYQITKPLAESRVIYVPGSTSRHRSIKCGLDAINELVEIGKEPAPDVVLVHDGVRPLVPAPLVSALVTAAAAHGAAGLTRPLVSTVLETPAGQRACLGRSLDRSRHRASETPQAFTYSVIRRAYQQCSEHELDHGTECLQLALTHAGVAARLLDGSPDLWKVTYRRDLHAFRGVLDDTVVRPAIVSTDLTLDDMRDSLILDRVLNDPWWFSGAEGRRRLYSRIEFWCSLRPLEVLRTFVLRVPYQGTADVSEF